MANNIGDALDTCNNICIIINGAISLVECLIGCGRATHKAYKRRQEKKQLSGVSQHHDQTCVNGGENESELRASEKESRSYCRTSSTQSTPLKSTITATYRPKIGNHFMGSM